MKIVISLFSLLAGLLFGLVIGWHFGRTPDQTRERVNRSQYLTLNDMDEARREGEVTIAYNALGAEKQHGDKFFAQVIATCYFNMPSNSPNGDTSLWRSDIEQLAKTNSLVAAELEADAKIIQTRHE